MGKHTLESWDIEMLPLELTVSTTTGITRRIKSREDKRKETPMKKGNEWQYDISGAIVEMALAKALNVYWVPSVDTFKLPDVGSNIQVRSTSLDGGKLIVRARDNPEEIYVLGIEKTPIVSFRGWIWGSEAKQDEHWFNPNNGMPGAWFVAQNKLRDMNELKTTLEQVRSITLGKEGE